MIPWIKVRTNLDSDPKVLAIAQATHQKPLTALGACVKFWAWCDGVTADGKLRYISERQLDRQVGVRGFTRALLTVNWLARDAETYVIPGFERHNGTGAKRRLVDAEAQRCRRGDRRQGDGGGDQTTGAERRGQETPPSAPRAGGNLPRRRRRPTPEEILAGLDAPAGEPEGPVQ
jgi:hypothetical protein